LGWPPDAIDKQLAAGDRPAELAALKPSRDERSLTLLDVARAAHGTTTDLAEAIGNARFPDES
jgi:hypothetical protein